ncbi:hypothetical protein CU100_14435 [Phyllobacterium endophyticum]|uniref:Uncharacterized protein n=1 Tax=Phyllobacterium endophyticum TaxID=1149773 RepID=A0A2P7AR01_9HYPH|nr:hypothetical protein CU100_14435 [Phyllobacterium endophyticum]
MDQELWAILDRHARLSTSIQALQTKVPSTHESRHILAIKILEEQILRKQLIDIRPSTNHGAQSKLIYLSLMLAKTRTSLSESSFARVMRSVERFL